MKGNQEEMPAEEQQNRIVKKMARGGFESWIFFLFAKAALLFVFSAVLSCPLWANFRGDGAFASDLFKSIILSFCLLHFFLLILGVLKENKEFFALKIVAVSGLLDILFLVFLAWVFRYLDNLLFLLFGLVFAENLMAFWLFFLLIKKEFLAKRVKRQVEGSFALLREKLFKIKVQNRQIKELSQMKDEFLKIVNHQLRTPVSVIRGLSSALIEEKMSKAQENKTKKNLVLASQRLNSILDDLLQAQSFIGQKPEPILTPCDLVQIAQKIVQSLRWQAKQRGLKIVFKKSRNKVVALADKDMLEKIIARLLENAFEYSPKGKVKIEVAKNKIIITDTGIGFSQSEKRNFFTPFFRSKRAMLLQPNGSGLGLYIARQLAISQGGDIIAKSDGIGRGSRFSFVLPV